MWEHLYWIESGISILPASMVIWKSFVGLSKHHLSVDRVRPTWLIVTTFRSIFHVFYLLLLDAICLCFRIIGDSLKHFESVYQQENEIVTGVNYRLGYHLKATKTYGKNLPVRQRVPYFTLQLESIAALWTWTPMLGMEQMKHTLRRAFPNPCSTKKKIVLSVDN